MDNTWDPNAEKYKLFNKVHVKKAALYIGVMQVVFLFFQFIAELTMSKEHWAFITVVYLTVLGFILALIFGIWTERKGYVITYLVLSGFAILFISIELVIDLKCLDKLNETENRDHCNANGNIFRELIDIIVEAFCFSVIWRYYHFIERKNTLRQQVGPVEQQLNIV